MYKITNNQIDINKQGYLHYENIHCMKRPQPEISDIPL